MSLFLPATMIILVVLMLGVLACGHSATKTTAARLTRSALVARAESICKQLNHEISNANNSVPSSHNTNKITSGEITQVVQQRIAAESLALAAFHKLTPPASMTNSWRHLIEDRQRLTTDMATLGANAARHDLPNEQSAYLALTNAQHRVVADATQTGMATCTQIS